ncbi:MAG: hypothetical protein V4493_11130 [Pseudomonadota bacterium]
MSVSVADDMSIFSLVAGASLPVQFVLAVLIIVSLFSWWYIFIKVATMKRAETNAEDFENAFWTGGDLNKLFEGISAGHRKSQGMASIFEAGFKEYARHKQQPRMEVSDVMEGSRRAMRASTARPTAPKKSPRSRRPQLRTFARLGHNSLPSYRARKKHPGSRTHCFRLWVPNKPRYGSSFSI